MTNFIIREAERVALPNCRGKWNKSLLLCPVVEHSRNPPGQSCKSGLLKGGFSKIFKTEMAHESWMKKPRVWALPSSLPTRSRNSCS